MSQHAKVVSAALVLATLLAACSGAVPSIVETRPNLSDCAQGQEVYLPVRQGPDASEDQSQTALACFLDEVALGEEAELEFILIGTEGEEYRSILQKFADGTLDYFRENDWGWEIYLECTQFLVEVPEIPEVSGCDSVEIDGPG
jgi:hypothetical protein